MRISILLCSDDTERHIWSKHRMTAREAEEAAYASRLIVRGRGGAHEVYGQTDAGRYVVIVVRRVGKDLARLITARDLTSIERRRYQRHISH